MFKGYKARKISVYTTERFYREIRKLPIEDHELEQVRTEIKEEAYSLLDSYNFWNELNISNEEFFAIERFI